MNLVVSKDYCCLNGYRILHGFKTVNAFIVYNNCILYKWQDYSRYYILITGRIIGLTIVVQLLYLINSIMYSECVRRICIISSATALFRVFYFLWVLSDRLSIGFSIIFLHHRCFVSSRKLTTVWKITGYRELENMRK